MLNKVMLIGRLGKDPELKYTQSGVPVANLNVATDESYVDKDGNRQERTEWHRVVVFQKAAENCRNYLAKGSLVYIEGSLQTRKWQDQQGQDRYTTEVKAQRVQFLDRRGERSDEPPYDAGGGEGGYGRAPQGRNQAWGGNDWNSQNAPRRQRGDDDDRGPVFPSEIDNPSQGRGAYGEGGDRGFRQQSQYRPVERGEGGARQQPRDEGAMPSESSSMDEVPF